MFGRLDALKQRRSELDAAEAAWLDDLAEYHHSGDWRDEHYASAAAAIGSVCHMDSGVAHAHVNLARKLEKLPEIADAFRAGDISARHASVVATAFTGRAPRDCRASKIASPTLPGSIPQLCPVHACAGSPT